MTTISVGKHSWERWRLNHLVTTVVLGQATFELVKENADPFARKAPLNPDELCDQLDLSLEQSELVIDKVLFERPAELPILDTDLRDTI